MQGARSFALPFDLAGNNTPAKSLVNAVAVKTYLQVSRNQTGMYKKRMRTLGAVQRRRRPPQQFLRQLRGKGMIHGR